MSFARVVPLLFTSGTRRCSTTNQLLQNIKKLKIDVKMLDRKYDNLNSKFINLKSDIQKMKSPENGLNEDTFISKNF